MSESQQENKTKNKVNIEDAGPCKKKVLVEIPEQSIKETADQQYETLRKEAVVPGFRKGRAPRRLLEKRFGKENSKKIKLTLLADASDSAIKDNELDILQEPDIDYENIELPDKGPLKFDFEVEVKPEFQLPELKEIPIEKPKLEVTKDQIEREIEQAQKWSGIWAPKEDGKIEVDDQIIADATLKIEDTDKEEKFDNTEIYIRKNGYVGPIPVENLDEILKGAKAGDLKQTTVEVPKTFFKEKYRGKKVGISIKINEVKYLKPALLDENFLKRFGVENEKQLREKVEESLNDRLQQQARNQMRDQIYKYMLDNTDFDLPMDIVADQTNSILQRQYANLLKQGLPQEQINENMEKLHASSEEQAKQQMKTFFIIDKVAEKLDIDVTDEEINGQIAQAAIQRGQRPEKLREQMAQNGSLGQFKVQVREDKCIAKLLDSAKITKVKPKKKTTKKKTKKKTEPKSSEKTKKTKKKTTKKKKKSNKITKKKNKKETKK